MKLLGYLGYLISLVVLAIIPEGKVYCSSPKANVLTILIPILKG